MARALAAATVAALLALPFAGAGFRAQEPQTGGAVVFGAFVAAFSEPPCLTVIIDGDTCSGFTAFWIWDEVLAGAFVLAPDLTFREQLVSHVEYTRTPPFTLTYHIRPEARWSDGVPVTAGDFVFTHQAIRRLLPPDSPNVHFQVRSIRALGKKIVRVVLRSRMAEWRLLFDHVLPRHALAGEDLRRIWRDGIDDPRTGKPIGSGPFLVGSWEQGRQLTLVRNPRYWGQHVAHLDRIVLRFCGSCVSATVLETLRSREVDIALIRDTGIVSDLRRIRGIRVFWTPSLGWEHLELRVRAGGHPALRQKLVRRALAYGIDRVAIARELFRDLDSTYRPSDSAVFLNNDRHYKPAWSHYRYRPARARRLLEQAGCRAGPDRIYVCAGERLLLRVVTTAGNPLRQRAFELIQRQLRSAGVEVVPAFPSGFSLFGEVLPSGDFDVAMFVWFGSGEPGGKSVFGCGGDQNYTGYCQRLVTSDLDQAERILEPEARARSSCGQTSGSRTTCPSSRSTRFRS